MCAKGSPQRRKFFLLSVGSIFGCFSKCKIVCTFIFLEQVYGRVPCLKLLKFPSL